MTDEEILHGCIKKQADAQKVLYEKYARKMMGVCLRYGSSTEEAEDMLQEGFIKVFEKIETFNNKGSLEGWVRRVIVNTALDLIRKNKKLQQNIDFDSVDYQLRKDDHVLEKIAAQDIMKLVQSLPAGFRTVFNLFAIEGYSHKEIGEKLGISENTSKSQYSRARAHLKELVYKHRIVVKSE